MPDNKITDSSKTPRDRAAAWAGATMRFGRSRRARRIGIWTFAVVIFLGVAAYFGVPPLLRHILVGQVAQSLKRPVSVGRISFDLYTLRLDVDQLHIGEPDNSQAFADIGHLRVRASWTSIFRLAPVVKEVTITKPQFHIVRVTENRFNFSDLLEPSTPPAPKKPGGKPTRFAVSNIRLIDGEVHFDDKVLAEQHKIEDIQIGIPFVANLPADAGIYVQPLLEMVVDGSPFRINGRALPFAVPAESVLDLNLHQLELPRYAGYVPKRIAIKLPGGTFSCSVQVHFVNADPASADARPLIRLSGVVALDQLDLRDGANAPLLELRHAVANLTDIEPLGSLVSLGKIWVDGLTVHAALNHDGTNNFASVISSEPPPVPAAAASSAPAASPAPSAAASPAAAVPAAPLTQTTEAPPQKSPTDLSLESFELTDSSVKFVDNRGATPNPVSINGIHVTLNQFHTTGQGTAPYSLDAKLGSGGTIAVKGSLDMANSKAATQLAIEQVDLPALQGFGQPAFAGNLASGKLSAHATLATTFGPGHFNVHAEPADLSIQTLKIDSPGAKETPVQWNNLSIALGQFDLASHQAVVKEVRSDGIALFVRRGKRGEISLASLVRSPEPPSASAPKKRGEMKPAPKPEPKPAAGESAPPTWTYKVESVALEKTALQFQDLTTPSPADLKVAPLSIHLKDISSDLRKPISLELAGTLNQKGSFNVTGTAVPIPLKADLKIVTNQMELAGLDPYVSSHLNATISGAALTMKGAVGLDNSKKDFKVSYRGDVSVGNVSVLDKVTRDKFVKWKTLSVTRIKLNIGDGPPKINLGGIALDTFYARIILRENGTMNLKEVMANPNAAPTSLTRTQQPAGAAPAPEVNPAAPPPPAPGSDIQIGGITLQRGHINYSDNFIKPNYTADLTDITGKIGAFGTGATKPADVTVDGQVNGSSPIDISGQINPLAPMASLDIKAKADGVELTGLTPYSTNYAGYPIIKGTLSLDVHYVLNQGNLTADNHILLDQLTFGDPIAGPHTTKLPLRLAIALLKNSKGQIDLNIPVSGSLADPKFSVGDVIWGALKNLILKVATSPFSLLAAAIPGGGGGGSEALSYVAFAPGMSTLTPDAQTSLATVASGLQARPSLNLSIEGRVDPAFDTEGLREATLTKRVALAAGKTPGEDDWTNLTPAEYAKYLPRVYYAATFAKQKNVLGLDKSIPPDDMKKLLLANIQVSDQDLKNLADKRAAVVRKFMSGKVEPARLFLTAPKLNADGITDKGKTTRVDLSFD